MAVLFIPLWKEAPFIRIVLPFIVGIALAEYGSIPIRWLYTGVASSLLALLTFSLGRLSFKFRYAWAYGLLLNLLLTLIGALILSLKESSTVTLVHPPFIVSIKQPLSEKPKSWKAVMSSNITVYFRKDSLLNKPVYGDRIAFMKLPENNRVFLNANEFIYLEGKDINPFHAFLYDLQAWVVETLQRYIPGKKECGLAEALLIGYKDDLDRDLMKAYSNTGVVHVVAISGLHLGLIYMLLKYLCYPFSRRKSGKWITPLIIISGLWVFSLLAGGSPSVMRSAVMFTFIVAGESFRKKTSIYNNLAASAFFLLCFDPRWLWDIGFQLSYTALLSIVIFMKPIYNLLVVRNRLLDAVWKLNAVTLSAQILTTPICVFYFNQFPNLFLFTNFIAVPVSSVILVGEIALCAISTVPAAAGLLGVALSLAIKFMNGCVEWLGSFSFSTTGNLHIDFSQVIAFYAVILFGSIWLLHRKRIYVFPALVFAIVFCLLCHL